MPTAETRPYGSVLAARDDIEVYASLWSGYRYSLLSGMPYLSNQAGTRGDDDT